MLYLANIGNAVLFQLTWFGCVIYGIWGCVPLLTMLFVAYSRRTLEQDLPLVTILGMIGFGVDTLWIYLGILRFELPVGDALTIQFAPMWIVFLWMGVALTIDHSMQFFRDRPVIGATLAGGVAPLTYLTGERLGGVDVPQTAGLALIACAWFVLFWCVFTYAGRRAREGVSIAP